MLFKSTLLQHRDDRIAELQPPYSKSTTTVFRHHDDRIATAQAPYLNIIRIALKKKAQTTHENAF